MTKQLEPFNYTLPNGTVVEVNCRVDERTEQEVYDEVIDGLQVLYPKLVITKSSIAIHDIHFFTPSITHKEEIEKVNSAIGSLPIKIYYLPNNENIYIEYDPLKTVTIQSVLYHKFDVKEIILASKEWENKICKLAIEESKKETIT